MTKRACCRYTIGAHQIGVRQRQKARAAHFCAALVIHKVYQITLATFRQNKVYNEKVKRQEQQRRHISVSPLLLAVVKQNFFCAELVNSKVYNEKIKGQKQHRQVSLPVLTTRNVPRS